MDMFMIRVIYFFFFDLSHSNTFAFAFPWIIKFYNRTETVTKKMKIYDFAKQLIRIQSLCLLKEIIIAYFKAQISVLKTNALPIQDFPEFWPDSETDAKTYDDMLTVQRLAANSSSVDNLKATFDQSEITEKTFKATDLRVSMNSVHRHTSNS